MSNNTNTNINGLRVTPLQDQSSFAEWIRTVCLTLHKQGRSKYVTTDYTAIVQAVDDYDAEHTAHLFEALDITSTISIASESTSGEKSSAAKAKSEDIKKKQIAAFVGDEPALKAARKLCKGRRKTFVFICSTIAPELLEDISGMSDGCPLALWTAINNRYGNNDVALQAARCDLGWPDFYLVCPGDTVRSIWARIQALVNVLAVETGGHKMSERSCLMILATALKSINPAFEAQFNALADNTATEAVLKALDHVKASHHASPSSDTILYASQGQHHGRLAFQHHQVPYGVHVQMPLNSLPLRHPTGPRLPRQQRHDNWGSNRGRWCSLHNSSGHSLEECREAAARGLTGAMP